VDVDCSSSSSWLVRRKYLDQHAAVSDMRWENATKRRRSFLFSTSSSSFVARTIIVVAVVRATEAVTIEEAYFWSTRHAETDPVVDSGGEKETRRARETERETDRLSDEKTTTMMMKEKKKKQQQHSTARHGTARQLEKL
jgi:hypothetical protein